MNCQQIEQDEIIERYLAGKLPAPLGEEFEDHYFGCDACLRNLQAYRAVRTAVLDRQESIQNEGRRRASLWWPAGALIAAGLAATFVLSRKPPAPPPQIAQAQPPSAAVYDPLTTLGRFDPPTYQAVAMRDASSPGKTLFTNAMREYTQANYAQAIPGLRGALEKESDNPAYGFFLGVTCLLAAQTDAGITALQKVAAAGDTPFQDEAWFYLSKGYLRRGDIASARAALRKAIALGREQAAPSQLLLDKLPSVR